jgi:hypothetical protein
MMACISPKIAARGRRWPSSPAGNFADSGKGHISGNRFGPASLGRSTVAPPESRRVGHAVDDSVWSARETPGGEIVPSLPAVGPCRGLSGSPDGITFEPKFRSPS